MSTHSIASPAIGPRTPSPWPDVFMSMAEAIAHRSKDPRTQHGAVLVDALRCVVATGFNGPPRNYDDGELDWSAPAKYACIVHAEINAVLHGLAQRGEWLDGCTLYVTGHPCSRCMPLIAQSGVYAVHFGLRRSVMVDDADQQLARRLARLGGVNLYQHRYGGVLELVEER